MKRKTIIITAILFAAFMITVVTFLYAKPVYQGQSHYKGKDGKWYWVEHYTDSFTGDEYSKIWIHGDNGSPHIGNGHIEPNKLVGDDGNVETPTPVPLPLDYGYDIDLKADGPSIAIKTAKDVNVDVIMLEGGERLYYDIFVAADASYQRLDIPTLNINQVYGLLIRSAENSMPIYSRIFYTNASGYYLEPNE